MWKIFCIVNIEKRREILLMKYNVTYKIDARYVTEVEANSIEEAKNC